MGANCIFSLMMLLRLKVKFSELLSQKESPTQATGQNTLTQYTWCQQFFCYSKQTRPLSLTSLVGGGSNFHLILPGYYIRIRCIIDIPPMIKMSLCRLLRRINSESGLNISLSLQIENMCRYRTTSHFHWVDFQPAFAFVNL